jgi:hypothetical protein
MTGMKMAREELKGIINSLPYVSDEEQKEVEKMFGGKPTEEPVVYEENIKTQRTKGEHYA